MKAYFMAWESDNKSGHSIWEFEAIGNGKEISPRVALTHMIDSVTEEFSKSDPPIEGVVRATQFNLVT